MIRDTVEAVRVALELFPRCAKCGEILDPSRLTVLRASERPNRYEHIECRPAA